MRKKTHRLAAGKKREASARSPIGLCYNGLGFHFEIGRSFVILIRITPPLANELARSIHRTEGGLCPLAVAGNGIGGLTSLPLSRPRGGRPPKSADILTWCHCHCRSTDPTTKQRSRTRALPKQTVLVAVFTSQG